MTLHLILAYRWFDLIAAGHKTVEYRAVTPRWTRLIWQRRHLLTEVCVHRGYTAHTLTRRIAEINIGPTPYPDFPGPHYRLHLAPKPPASFLKSLSNPHHTPRSYHPRLTPPPHPLKPTHTLFHPLSPFSSSLALLWLNAGISVLFVFLTPDSQ